MKELINEAEKQSQLSYSSYFPGSLSILCALQTNHYAKTLDFDYLYESAVALSVGGFLQRFNPAKDFVCMVLDSGEVAGGIAIDHLDGKVARLRWFYVSEHLRGKGIGHQLIDNAMDFVKQQNFEKVFLTTIDGLNAARRQYERVGFVLVEEKLNSTWGKETKEQRFEWTNPNYG